LFVKKYLNFLNLKIIFRCDAADIPEISTGHLYRSIIVANFLKRKFNIRSQQIGFVVKTKNKYSKNLQILKNYNFRILKLNNNIKDYSKEEARYLSKHKANLLVIDRLGKIKKKFFDTIKNNYNKKIIFDDSSYYRKLFDLSLNPLIQNVPKFKNSRIGYKYQILQYPIKTKFKLQKNINNIFLFFGGFDKKKHSLKVVKQLNKITPKLNIILPTNYRRLIRKIKSKHKMIFYESKEYLKKLSISNIAITGGGIALFDSILNKKKIICIPQYYHQKINAKKIAKTKAVNFLDSNDKKFNIKFLKVFSKIYDDERYQRKINTIQNRIINIKMLSKTFRLISKIYEKSKN